MKEEPIITGVELYTFGNAHALKIHTDAGITGEYVASWPAVEAAPIQHFGSMLLGQNALEREKIYHEVKRVLRHLGRMGLAPVDNALWDIAGKYYNAPIYELLGGYRKKLPAYVSTLHSHEDIGLGSPEAMADFAEQCLEMGYRAFKIHPWWITDPISREVECVHAVGKRVGGKMDLMLDPSCAYETFADALKVGRACDEEGFFWYEDPFQDGGISHFAYRKLRQLIKTPLLLGEHVRGLEPRIDFALADATDFIRGDVSLDGITSTMKLAHAAESIGLDVELHGGSYATMHCMAAIRNSNYLEWGLFHPKHEEKLAVIDKDGCISVPEGPGLGEEHDWKYIEAHKTGYIEFRKDSMRRSAVQDI